MGGNFLQKENGTTFSYKRFISFKIMAVRGTGPKSRSEGDVLSLLYSTKTTARDSDAPWLQMVDYKSRFITRGGSWNDDIYTGECDIRLEDGPSFVGTMDGVSRRYGIVSIQDGMNGEGILIEQEEIFHGKVVFCHSEKKISIGGGCYIKNSVFAIRPINGHKIDVKELTFCEFDSSFRPRETNRKNLAQVFEALGMPGPYAEEAGDIDISEVIEQAITFVQGDPHGALGKLKENLKQAGLINWRGAWKKGCKNRLVILGDYEKARLPSQKTFDYVKELRQQALEADGEVVLILGNHDEALTDSQVCKAAERRAGVLYTHAGLHPCLKSRLAKEIRRRGSTVEAVIKTDVRKTSNSDLTRLIKKSSGRRASYIPLKCSHPNTQWGGTLWCDIGDFALWVLCRMYIESRGAELTDEAISIDFILGKICEMLSRGEKFEPEVSQPQPILQIVGHSVTISRGFEGVAVIRGMLFADTGLSRSFDSASGLQSFVAISPEGEVHEISRRRSRTGLKRMQWQVRRLRMGTCGTEVVV
jgi:hypothetical protein